MIPSYSSVRFKQRKFLNDSGTVDHLRKLKKLYIINKRLVGFVVYRGLVMVNVRFDLPDNKFEVLSVPYDLLEVVALPVIKPKNLLPLENKENDTVKLDGIKNKDIFFIAGGKANAPVENYIKRTKKIIEAMKAVKWSYNINPTYYEPKPVRVGHPLTNIFKS